MGAFDEIILKYGQPNGGVPAAQARFSRAPITFQDRAAVAKNPENARAAALGHLDLLMKIGVGRYDEGDKAIEVSAPSGGWDAFKTLQGMIRHEDVHGVLNNVGRARADLPPSLRRIPPDGPTAKPLDSIWEASKFMGDFNAEIPAYLTAYRPGDMPTVSADEARQWVQAYSKTLPADARDKILRLGEISRGSNISPLPPLR